jgi:PIN domain nuclease of toxin-antitoxin system
VRSLLDTHIVLWAMADDIRLSAAARQAMEAATVNFVSAASIWEIGIKLALGKLDLDLDALCNGLIAAGFEPLPVTWGHSRVVRDLPHYHRDPFDRMLIAQAISEPLRLLTSDRMLVRYSELVVLV